MSRDLNVDQIKKLWILDLIIQNKSLKKAAAQAKVSPSAISQALSTLEKSLGRTLIIRDRGYIEATQEAFEILQVVRPAFEVFKNLRALSESPAPHIAWLNFGTYESIAIDLLPALLRSLRQKMPLLRLNLRISRTSNLLSLVRKGELCAALITEVDDLDRFYTKDVAVDRLGFYVSARHPVAQAGWKAIKEVGLGSLAPNKDGLPRYFTKFMNQFDSLRPAVLSESFETLRACAVSGTLVSVLPHRVATRTNELVEVLPPKFKSLKESGRHRICVVSRLNCDIDETDYLASEASRILNA